MIWLLAIAALAGPHAEATGTAPAVVRITLTAWGEPPPPPPAVLVNRTREPFDRYADTENRRALAARRPTNV